MSVSGRVALSALLLFHSVSAIAAPPKKAEATAKLLAAAAAGDEDDILAAVAAGADVNARDPEKNTPLILMASESLFGKERQIVEAMVAAKARVNDAGAGGVTALMAAAAAGRDGMARLLLQNEAKIDMADNDGWTALMYASASGEWSVVKELIDAEANVNAADKQGWTPLMMALLNGRGGVAERLIKAGAKMPVSAPNGLSAILLATYGRDLASVRHVLETDAALDGRDSDGWTALEVAAYNGDGQIVMDLLRAGADVKLEDKEGKRALDRAVEQENTELIAILGGPWKKPAFTGGTTLTVPCPALGGNVTANFSVSEGTLVVATTYPRPLTWYLGGGNTNRARSAKNQVYEGSFTPAYEIDGEGSKHTIDYSQYGTSVVLEYRDSKGNARSKQVYANVLDVGLDKGGTSIDTSELGDARPRAANDAGVLVTRVPLSLLGLAPGKTVRTTARIGACKEVSGKVKL